MAPSGWSSRTTPPAAVDQGVPRFPVDLVDDSEFLHRSTNAPWSTSSCCRYRNGNLELAGPPSTDRTLELSVILEAEPIRLVDPAQEQQLPPEHHRGALCYHAVLQLMGREQRESETYQRIEARLAGLTGAIIEAATSRTGAETFYPVYTRRR